MKKILLMLLFIATAFIANAQDISFEQVGVKVKQGSFSEYGLRCVYVEVSNFDCWNKNHWDAIKSYSKNYCNIYRDAYFSLYFIEGSFDFDDCEYHFDLHNPVQKEIYYSKVIAYISLRLPDNPTTGERREEYLKLGDRFITSNQKFNSICTIKQFYSPCEN